MTMRLPPRKGTFHESTILSAFHDNKARRQNNAAQKIACSMPGTRRHSIAFSNRGSTGSGIAASRGSYPDAGVVHGLLGHLSEHVWDNDRSTEIYDEVPISDMAQIDRKLDHLISQLSQYHSSVCRMGTARSSSQESGNCDTSEAQSKQGTELVDLSSFEATPPGMANTGSADCPLASPDTIRIKPKGAPPLLQPLPQQVDMQTIRESRIHVENDSEENLGRMGSKSSHRGSTDSQMQQHVWGGGTQHVPYASSVSASSSSARTSECAHLDDILAAKAEDRRSRISMLKRPSNRDMAASGWLLSARYRRLKNIASSVRTAMCDSESGVAGKIYSIMVPIFVVLSLVPTFLQTWVEFRGSTLSAMEVISEVLFLLDVIVRFVVTPTPSLFWQESSHNLIDVLVPLPLLLRAFYGFNPSSDDLDGFPGSLCLYVVPLIRILKTLRGVRRFNLILTVAVQVYIDTIPSCFMLVYVVLVFSSIMYYVEPRDNIPTYAQALWYVIVTITSVGYGDIVPASAAGQAVSFVIVVSSVFVVAFPLGIIGSAVAEIWRDRDTIILRNWTKDRLDNLGYQAEDIPKFFMAFDNDGNGVLDFVEFCAMLEKMTVGITFQRTRELFKSFDDDGSGTVDAEEFVMKLYPDEYERLYPREPVKKRSTFMGRSSAFGPHGAHATDNDASVVSAVSSCASSG